MRLSAKLAGLKRDTISPEILAVAVGESGRVTDISSTRIGWKRPAWHAKIVKLL